MGPNDKIILKDSRERQGDFVFTAQTAGEYRFCFSNEGYTASDKMVDFEIAVCQFLFWFSPFRPLAQSQFPIRRLTLLCNRSKTSPAPRSSPRKPALPRSKPLRSKIPSSKSAVSSALSAACRNISVHERTGILAQSGAQKAESSISAWLKWE